MSIDRDNPLAAEIQQEIAQNYFAACRKMVEALEALKEFDNGFDSSSPEVKAARRSALLEQARERVYFLVIQREAMKLSAVDKFFDDYEVPEEVRANLGQKRS
jgi:hypothetical protein